MEKNVWLHRILYQEDGNRRAVVCIALIVINVLIWGILELTGDTFESNFILAHGGMYPPLLTENKEYYRLFTAMFLHFGPQHLANNMILLGAAGDKLEKTTGSVRFLLIYLGAGLLGSLFSFYGMLQTGDYAVSAGASGAVFGIIGALLWAAVYNRGKVEGLTVKGLLVMIALCLYYGITTTGVDNRAHIGGAIGGFILCILFYRKNANA